MEDNFLGCLLLLLLGLRHGLDPDHIAIVDGYTYQLHQQKKTWTKWVGTFFALGHGFMVTLIALFLSLVKSNIKVPDYLSFILEWLPVAMLFYLGCLNLKTIITGNKKHAAIKQTKIVTYLITKKLNPLTIVLTGLLFGFIFDTSTQIAAFGYAVSSTTQWLFAVAGGVIFSAGMMVTGTFDSMLLSQLLKDFDRKQITRHRWKLTILLTLICLLVPVYKIACEYQLITELSDFQNTMFGLLFIGIVVALYGESYVRLRYINKK